MATGAEKWLPDPDLGAWSCSRGTVEARQVAVVVLGRVRTQRSRESRVRFGSAASNTRD
jgi:hypothetical protein